MRSNSESSLDQPSGSTSNYIIVKISSKIYISKELT
jgi:hypothetical protein